MTQRPRMVSKAQTGDFKIVVVIVLCVLRVFPIELEVLHRERTRPATPHAKLASACVGAPPAATVVRI